MDSITTFIDGLNGWVPYAVFALVGVAAFIAPIGALLPCEVFFAVAGILASQGQISAPLAFVVVLASAALGLSLSFLGGAPVHRWTQGRPPTSKLRPALGKSEKMLRRRGPLAMIIGCWMPLRCVLPLLMGSARYSYPRFLAAGLIGAAVWTGACIGGGYAIGPAITQYTNVIAIVLTVALVVVVVTKRLRARNRPAKAADDDAVPPPLNPAG
ncbi:DedA family protein [Streptomyces huasconensis]|uniref:DedA family protein n=1 Tax=Streptomyces huasconensis TaxID=1854574 RepID=UPI0036FD1953